jgi:hypothetical protein
MLPFDLDRVTPADVTALVANQVRETRHLDYKAALPSTGNEERKEFLADVTSFANAGGGALVYGVSETKGDDGKNTGIPAAIVGLGSSNLDAEILRLDNWLRTGVEPRLPSHRFHAVDGLTEGPVLVLTIGQSWLGPHMVAVADSRFYSRTSAGKYPLDVGEIRNAFFQSDELPARLRRWRDERLGLIASGETPVQLRDGARVAMHLNPFSSFDRSRKIDFDAWTRASPAASGGSLSGRHFNADGHVGYTGGTNDHGQRAYLQFFRSGAVESVAVYHHMVENVPVMNIWHAEKEIVDGIRAYLPILDKIGAGVPIGVSVALLGIRGYGLVPSILRDLGGTPVVRRAVVVLPEILIENLGIDVPTMLRPVFDALWQTFGVRQSLCFDEQGSWNPDVRW